MQFKEVGVRAAIGTAVIAGVVVVVLIAAVAGYFLLSQGSSQPTTSVSSTPSSTTTTTTTTTTTSTTSTTTATSSTTTSSSTSSSTTTTSSTTSSTSTSSTTSSSAPPSFAFTLTAAPPNIVLSPGSSLFYPSLTITGASSSTPNESVRLNSTLPAGITVSFDSNPVKVSAGASIQDAMTFTVGQSVAPGDYKVTIGGSSGASSAVTTFTLHVVQYLVLEQSNTFVNGNFTVKAGTTVWWINLDAPAGGDREIHNVVFTSGATSTSPDMAQYATYSYTFATAGTYSYFCSYHPSSMQAKIIVTP